MRILVNEHEHSGKKKNQKWDMNYRCGYIPNAGLKMSIYRTTGNISSGLSGSQTGVFWLGRRVNLTEKAVYRLSCLANLGVLIVAGQVIEVWA